MPRFNLIPLEEAKTKAASTGKRGEILKEYISYIQQLKEGQAGKLQVSPGERVGSVRRRLGSAAKLLEKGLAIKRVGDELYFWVQTPTKRRRGRPRKSP